MNSYGKTLNRYPLAVKQVIPEEPIYLLSYAMNKVTKVGTAKYLSHALPAWKNAAGKTGTTNKNVDSWFAGFTGQHVASVWIGRDDNKPTGFTGAAGALRVWADFFKRIPTKPFKPTKPKSIKFYKVDKMTGLLYNPVCSESATVPFIVGTEPEKMCECKPQIFYDENGSPIASMGSAAVWDQKAITNTRPNNTITSVNTTTPPKKDSIKWSAKNQNKATKTTRKTTKSKDDAGWIDKLMER
jgi:penicillin-binding protein 1B